MCHFFSRGFKDFFLSSIFISLIMIYLGMSFLGFILSSWICKFMFFTKLENFSVLFIKYILLHCIFFLLFFWPPVANTKSFGFVPLIFEVLFILFPTLCFFLCSNWVIFVVIFKFTDSFLCHLHSVIEAIQWLLFYFTYCSLKFLFIYMAALGLSCDTGDLCCVMWGLSLWHMDCTMQFCSFCLLVGYAQNPSS